MEFDLTVIVHTSFSFTVACDATTDCNGQGTCNEDGTCSCNTGYVGSDCSGIPGWNFFEN